MNERTVRDALQAMQAPSGTLAAMCGGEVLEMGDPLPPGAQVTPITIADDEGRRIYERSLRFVMLLALRRLYPGQQVRIEYSVGQGVFVRLPGVQMDEARLGELERLMRQLAEEDLPFTRRQWTLKDAIRYFEQDGQSDKVALLKCRPYDYFRMYECGGMWEYFYGAMAPSTGAVRVFGLTLHAPGFVLRLPRPDCPDQPAPYVDRPRHLAVFEQSARWCSILGVVNAADVTALMRSGGMRNFIRVNEALHDSAIAGIAERIVAEGKRIVLVAGPSSSGKTTFTARLGIHLQVLGCRPVQISLDDYYLDRDQIPLEPDGSVDLEHIRTLDIPLLQDHLARLLQGEEVEIPHFDFRVSKRAPQGHRVRLEPGHPVLVEGIHGLNPALSDRLPQEVIHRVFVSALTCINLDDHNRIRTTDVRLLRRIVRDCRMRGSSPEETLAMWPSVRRGEERWIFPWQETADDVFNTALHYELPVLRQSVSALLEAVPPVAPGYVMARRLCKVLHYFPGMAPDIMEEIPPLSLLREFVGGSTLDKA